MNYKRDNLHPKTMYYWQMYFFGHMNMLDPQRWSQKEIHEKKWVSWLRPWEGGALFKLTHGSSS